MFFRILPGQKKSTHPVKTGTNCHQPRYVSASIGPTVRPLESWGVRPFWPLVCGTFWRFFWGEWAECLFFSRGFGGDFCRSFCSFLVGICGKWFFINTWSVFVEKGRVMKVWFGVLKISNDTDYSTVTQPTNAKVFGLYYSTGLHRICVMVSCEQVSRSQLHSLRLHSPKLS